jgi:glycosyltransferase involved in cell wall biosynthesis
LSLDLQEELMQGIHIHRLSLLFRVGNAPFLPSLLKLKEFDIIHLHFPFFGGELAALAANIRKIPLVITYHQDVQESGFLQVIEKILRATFSRGVLRSATRVIYKSLDYGKYSYSRAILHGREDRIAEVSNGVDPYHFKLGTPEKSLIKKYRPTGKEKLILLVAGLDRAHYFKGVPILLEVLSRQSDMLKAIIIGEGNMRGEYKKLLKELGLERLVYFLGRVSNEMLPQYYQIADVTVLPSTTMGEAFGLV